MSVPLTLPCPLLLVIYDLQLISFINFSNAGNTYFSTPLESSMSSVSQNTKLNRSGMSTMERPRANNMRLDNGERESFAG